VPERTTRAVGVEVPAAAADDAFGAGRRTVRVQVVSVAVAVRSVPVGRPLPHIAVHVAEAPRVQREAADERRPLSVLARRRGAVRIAAVVVGLRGAEAFAGREGT